MKILAIGAHPDDIEIGMGGLIAKESKKNEVLMLVLSMPSDGEKRLKEAEQGAKILGAELNVLDLDLEEIKLDRNFISKIDKVLEDFKPDEIYTHWHQDSHQDHTVTAQATFAATRQNKCSLYMYEQTLGGGITPFGFRAQRFVDISKEIDKKIQAVLAHKTQVEKNTEQWVEGIKSRAFYRGYQMRVKYAEAFEVVKIVEK